ncbi:hypothetical protein [Nocardioides sp.]|uniref:hypothetical protein n=1 Tax=Nocardioides sp. TaxID=35761 RepID=UPI002CC7C6B1|nr:hypothetical protein [Nocardioides sp.]HSX67628.1 hypothetical protein [Nocardioides sp.]
MRHPSARLALAVAPLVLLAGCGQSGAGQSGAGAIGDDATPATATPEALVAVALSHLTPDPDGIELYTRDAVIDDVGTTSPYIGGQLRWRSEPDWSLSVRVQPAGGFDPCDERTCEDLGDARISWQEAGEDAPGYVTVFVVDDDELRSVGFEGGFQGDPRDDELFVDLDELAAIVTDPAFALTTTQGAVDAGDALEL